MRKAKLDTKGMEEEPLEKPAERQGCALDVARQSGWEHSDNQDGHFGGRGGRMIVAARR